MNVACKLSILSQTHPTTYIVVMPASWKKSFFFEISEIARKLSNFAVSAVGAVLVHEALFSPF
jgi:hypothetical protein